MRKHILVLVGSLSGYKAYLDIPVEEAVEKYMDDGGSEYERLYPNTDLDIKTISFDEHFSCYDAE